MFWLGVAIGAIALVGVGLSVLLMAFWVNPPLPRDWRSAGNGAPRRPTEAHGARRSGLSRR